MREINIFDKGDKVYIEYEIETLIFKNGELYYKLKDSRNGTYLPNAYTSDELIPVVKVEKEKKNEE